MFSRIEAIGFVLFGLLFAVSSLHAQQNEQINPKIVLQTLPYGGIEVAAWTPDDRYLITAGDASRLVLIWDTKTGHVVDRIPLPGGSSRSATVTKRLLGMTVSEDGTEVAIRSQEVDAKKRLFTDQSRYGIARQTYRLNLQTRTIFTTAVGGGVMRLPSETSAEERAKLQEQWTEEDRAKFEEARKAREALLAQSESGQEPVVELAPLPASHDGKRTLVRDQDGLLIREAGKPDLALTLTRSLRFRDAALSFDGSILAMLPEPELGQESDKRTSTIELFDTSTGQFQNTVKLPGDYFRVQWADSNRLLATSTVETGSFDRGAKGAAAKAVLINTDDGKIVESFDPVCFIKIVPDGSYFAAGLSNCNAHAKGDFGLKRYDGNKKRWRNFGDLKLEANMRITGISVSETGQTLSAVTVAADGTTWFHAIDTRTGAVVKQRRFEGDGPVTKSQLLGDQFLLVSSDSGGGTWWLEFDEWLPMEGRSTSTRVLETDGSVVAMAGEGDDLISLSDVSGEQELAPLSFGRVIAGGFLSETPIFWALSAHDGLRMWDTSKPGWPVLLTTHFFADQGYVAALPDGRYDTNLGPDSESFRWVMPDRPFESLSPQTFMRDYYMPGLTEAIMTCSYIRDCDTVIPPPKPIAQLNRILPLVEIVKVETGETPDEAVVLVKVTENRDTAAPDGKSSGVYDLRLFRDYRFAAHTPDNQDLEPQDELADWRVHNKLVDDDAKPGDGIYEKTFRVRLPSAADANKPVFTAYAFNEDRVKSETAIYTDYVRPDMQPFQPRAFVISIGIDAYDEKRLKLDYAAADAQLINDQVADIPGYEMRRMVVAAKDGSDVKPTADAINMIMAMLAGFDREEGLKILAANGIDGSALDLSSPDDLIIISFSGHGWADKQRNFFLLPTDAAWPEGEDGSGEPHPHTLVNMDEMTMWLRVMDAADIVLIIDACHAGASVNTPNFKPGPLGDKGLGQLAYDKGIKILVATQAEDVAFEDSKLRHGLLTYALAGPDEGLVQADGFLDGSLDDRISLDEWINYPIYRLPTLNDDARITGGSEVEGSSFRFPGRVEQVFRKIQQPTLFDYGFPSKVILKGPAK